MIRLLDALVILSLLASAPAMAGGKTLYCAAKDFRGGGEFLNVSGKIEGPNRVTGITAYVASEKYALESDLTGIPNHHNDVNGALTFNRYVWPQASLVWKDGEHPLEKKTVLLLPKNLDALPNIMFLGHLLDNGRDNWMECFEE